jgi:protein-S-isoprenylcysteine O-methyltransferase Ste14
MSVGEILVSSAKTHLSMTRTLGPILKTILFTIFVPGPVLVLIPHWILGGFPTPAPGPLTRLGILVILLGAAIYFRCAWEFAVRGLGTPAPIAPTRFLVTTALHRYVRNPMYIGVFGVLLGQAATFRSARLLLYAAFFCVPVQLFVVFYEEPTLRRQFGESYEEYRRSVPRWIPRF